MHWSNFTDLKDILNNFHFWEPLDVVLLVPAQVHVTSYPLMNAIMSKVMMMLVNEKAQ